MAENIDIVKAPNTPQLRCCRETAQPYRMHGRTELLFEGTATPGAKEAFELQELRNLDSELQSHKGILSLSELWSSVRLLLSPSVYPGSHTDVRLEGRLTKSQRSKHLSLSFGPFGPVRELATE
ncbi:hypothetical protein E2C01_026487 [Portunus trituberculatus]|uniref:Uncharacterized protein n=1 Tax=Portunus trituberculatus TaxID=210409 RepID=A0A5B7EL32_PORTR|nr:hypothetical protein [Portunus trituberculatus]